MKKTLLLSLLFVLSLTHLSFSQTIIKMEKRNGVYYLPCAVNGLSLKFIFDTGANDVSISLTEAMFMLKNGYLSEDDVRGVEYYKIANGDLEEGTKLVLRKLKIGDKVLNNVEASIVHTLDAPLLLGQSVLERLGVFTFDYSTHTLILGKPEIKYEPVAEIKENVTIESSVMSNLTKQKILAVSTTDEGLTLSKYIRTGTELKFFLTYENIYQNDAWIYWTPFSEDCIFRLIDKTSGKVYLVDNIEGITDNANPPMYLNEVRSFTLTFKNIPAGKRLLRLLENEDAGCNTKWSFDFFEIK